MAIKPKIVHIRMTDELHEFLCNKAKKFGVSKSTLSRFLLEKAIHRELDLFMKTGPKEKKKK